VVIAISLPGADEARTPDKLEALCGSKALETLRRELVAAQAEIDAFPTENAWTCSNTDGAHTCHFAGGGEWAAAYSFQLVEDAERGLRLTGVIETEIGTTETFNDSFRAKAAAMLAKPKACK
jgi:hypothetical protein